MDDTGVLSLVGLDQVGIIGHAEAARLPRKLCRFPALWGHDDDPPPSPCGAASFGCAASCRLLGEGRNHRRKDGGRVGSRRSPRRRSGHSGESGDRLSRRGKDRSEEHTSELQSLMRISYAVFCLKNKTTTQEECNTTN